MKQNLKKTVYLFFSVAATIVASNTCEVTATYAPTYAKAIDDLRAVADEWVLWDEGGFADVWETTENSQSIASIPSMNNFDHTSGTTSANPTQDQIKEAQLQAAIQAYALRGR